jgi:intracellular septation protein A
MPWEHRTQPLADRWTFARRLAVQFLLAATLVVATLILGLAGYMTIGGLNLMDAFLESSMFLSGAGPLYTERSSTNALKLFSSVYALFSTLVVVSIVAIVASPVVHRVLHRLHLEKGAR